MHLNFQNIVTYVYEVQFLQYLLQVGIGGVDFSTQFTMFNNLIVFVHNIENSRLTPNNPKLGFCLFLKFG